MLAQMTTRDPKQGFLSGSGTGRQQTWKNKPKDDAAQW